MSSLRWVTLPILGVLALGACASKPDPAAVNSVNEARSQYAMIANDAAVASTAPGEKAKAEKHLQEAEDLLKRNKKKEDIMRASMMSTTWSKAAMTKAESNKLQGELERDLESQAELTRLGLETTDRGILLRLWNLKFVTGRADLEPTQAEKLNNFAKFLRDNPGLVILVEGHTDSVGGKSFNMNLSANRAKAIMMYMVEQGIDPSRMKGVGYGMSFPIDTNDTAFGRQKNRRVDLVVNDQMPVLLGDETVEMIEVMVMEESM